MEVPNVKRRLTCILAADAVGYSHQTSIDEEATLRVLAAHRAVIDGIIAFHEGRIVSTAGDSVLAEFASPVEAVRCAVEIQEALKTRNDSLPEHRRLHFRVGVNLGDVVVKNDDLLGDGVNVAARLEGIAEPGGVCISSSVYDQITGKLNLGFQDIGEQNLKNISRPIRAYRLAGTGAPTRAAPAPTQRPKQWAPWAIATLALAAVLGVATWKLGWLGGDPDRSSASPAAPATATNADDAGKLKVATEAATAMRAQMEEEAQRARREAEAIKHAADAELARARADAEASRAARLKAEAEMTTTRARIEADATTTRARTEADAMTRAAEAEMAKAAQARKDAETAARAAAATTAATAPTTVATLPARAANGYDGTWLVTRSCEKFLDVDAFTDQLVTLVRGGEIAIERGKVGQPGYLTLHGKVADDGSLTLTGHTVSRSKRNFGGEVQASLTGSLARDPRVLTGGWGGRHCRFTFARA